MRRHRLEDVRSLEATSPASSYCLILQYEEICPRIFSHPLVALNSTCVNVSSGSDLKDLRCVSSFSRYIQGVHLRHRYAPSPWISVGSCIWLRHGVRIFFPCRVYDECLENTSTVLRNTCAKRCHWDIVGVFSDLYKSFLTVDNKQRFQKRLLDSQQRPYLSSNSFELSVDSGHLWVCIVCILRKFPTRKCPTQEYEVLQYKASRALEYLLDWYSLRIN